MNISRHTFIPYAECGKKISKVRKVLNNLNKIYRENFRYVRHEGHHNSLFKLGYVVKKREGPTIGLIFC